MELDTNPSCAATLRRESILRSLTAEIAGPDGNIADPEFATSVNGR
jgi:hypothetical protein